MRQTRGIIILFVALSLIVTSFVRPALAQTVTTTTSSIVNRLGNTVTTTDTLVDGVLTSRSQQEIKPDGTIVVEKAWDFYSSGVASRYEEHRVLGTSTTTIVRTFDALGSMQTEYADMSTNGQLSVQRFSTFDAAGFFVTNEQRNLTTLADGSQVWVVTQETYSGSMLVSSQVNQYPIGTVFTDPFPIANPPAPAPDPVVTPAPDPVPAPDPAPAPAPDPVVTPAPDPVPAPDPAPALEMRPGHGFGDDHHEHTGPPGHEDNDDKAKSDEDKSKDDKNKKKHNKHEEQDDRDEHDDDD